MSGENEAIQQDVSSPDGTDEQEVKDAGVDKEVVPEEDKSQEEKPVSARDQMLADMDAKLDAERLAEQQAFLKGVSVEPMHPEPEPEEDELPEEYIDDPLAEYLVMDGNRPMFRAKINGEERLIPLDEAREQIQKREAAEVRLEKAAEAQKALEARAAEIEARAAEVKASMEQLASASQQSDSSPPDEGVSDEDLEKEVQDLVGSLFSGSEEEAAAKLVGVLKARRGPQIPAINPAQIANEAVAAAKQQLSEEALKKDIDTGFEDFREGYPDIIADPNLLRYADGLTNAIQEEHPDWKPSKVMLEAGKQTREWVQSFQKTSEPKPPSDRETRKRNLRPLPKARSARREPEPEEKPQTPQDALAEIRNARGQP